MHRKKGHVVNCPLQPPFIFNRIQAPCISFAMYLATCIKYSAALPAPMPPATSETSFEEAGTQIWSYWNLELINIKIFLKKKKSEIQLGSKKQNPVKF